jgi:hypothetical protein
MFSYASSAPSTALPSGRMHDFLKTAPLAAGLALLAACSDGGTGPAKVPSLTLEVSGFASDPRVLVLGDGGQSVACLFTFSLAATGDAGATATWAGATLRFYAGADRTTPSTRSPCPLPR